MREIKFRGLRTDGKGWVFGYYVYFELQNRHSILSMNPYYENIVIPESVGQFTGLKDSNGVDIYEGDIYESYFGHRFKVMFVSGAFVGGKSVKESNPIGWKADENYEDLLIDDFPSEIIKVIGNIHQNKELI
jgi:uncharacterized phage protein (TIGR01671 family)